MSQRLFRGAALLIGLWDLLVHSVVLLALVFMFRQPPKLMNDMATKYSQYPQPLTGEMSSEPSSNMLMHNKNFMSSNILLNRILEKRNGSHTPMDLPTRNYYSNFDLMTIKWAASLSRRKSLDHFLSIEIQIRRLEDKCVFLFVIFSATILILAHICGVLTVSLFHRLADSINSLLEQTIVYRSILSNQIIQCDHFRFIYAGFLYLHAGYNRLASSATRLPIQTEFTDTRFPNTAIDCLCFSSLRYFS